MKSKQQSATLCSKAVYYCLLYVPTALAVIFVWPGDYSMLHKTLVTVVVSLWANLGSLTLSFLGLLDVLLGMKLVTGRDRGFLMANAVITATMLMDMPSDTQGFREKILKHFLKF